MTTDAELLTRRQLEVVRVYVDAGGTKPAATRLGVAPSTVTSALGRARVRSGSTTTSQLIAELMRRGEL